MWAQEQDSQSLGDAARQARQKQKSQSTTAHPAADGHTQSGSKSPHVITNDEIPEQAAVSTGSPSAELSTPDPKYKEGKQPPEYWKSQILRVKSLISTLQRSIDTLNNSIRFAGGNYEKHVAWNERQRQKQQEVENMKSQLSELQKRLGEMQETARGQGYGSSVYDP
jgi:hypothetical protein